MNVVKMIPLAEQYLEPAPKLAGVSSREIVRRAIEFENPHRIPYSSIVPLGGDFCEVRVLELLSDKSLTDKKAFGEVYQDEWKVYQEVTGMEWDKAVGHPLADLTNLSNYHFPPIAAPERFGWAAPYIQRAHKSGKYVVGRDPIMMFERVRMLVGFENTMMSSYTHPEELRALVDRLTEMTIEIVDYWGQTGCVDGFMTIQDWGLQNALQVSPETFRGFYKSHYERVAQACHRHGMHYLWHSCGWIADIIPDAIEAGVNVLQLDQPRLMGHCWLADRFGGRITFWNSVDIQYLAQPDVSLTGEELAAEVEEMVRPFRRFDGGFIFRQYICPQTLGISDEYMKACYNAFLKAG